MSWTRIALVAALVATTAFLAACGGDDGDDGDDFVTQANELCAQGSADLVAGIEEAGLELDESPQNAEQAEALANVQVEVREEILPRLEALEPPEESAEEWSEYLRLQQVTIDHAREAAGKATDPGAYSAAFQESAAARDEARTIAADLGLDECSGEEDDEGEGDESTTTTSETSETETES